MFRRARHAAVALVVTSGLTGATLLAAPVSFADPVKPAVAAVAPSTGSSQGGTTVTVKGAHFSHARRVLFGGVAGHGLHVLSDGRLTVVSPQHAVGAVNVRVEAAFGTSASVYMDTFRYGLSPALSTVSPDQGSTEGGTQITISGAHLAGARQVLFGSTLGTDVRVRSASRLTVIPPRHNAGAVNIRVVTGYGTSPIVSGDRFRFGALPRITKVAPASGPTAGGTTVTVDGANLSGTNRVLFGGAVGQSLQVLSSTRLTVMTPVHTSGGVLVQLQNGYGLSHATDASRFTYTDSSGAPPGGQPSVTGVNPTSGDVAGGTSVTIAGSGLAGATSVLFDGVTGTSLTVQSDNSVTASSPAHATGTVEVQVVTPSGTSLTGPADRFTYVAAPASPPPTDSSPPPSRGPSGVGSISGVVLKAEHSTGLAGVTVEISPRDGVGDVYYATTASDGAYAVANVPAGSYRVCFFPDGTVDASYVGQCFSKSPIDGSGSPKDVTVLSGVVTSSVDANLVQAGGISGTVTGPNNAGVGGIEVVVDPSGDPSGVAYTTTAEDGTYSVLGLAAGTYTVCFYPPSGFVPGFLKQCFNAVSDGTQPTAVPVTAGATTQAVGASLVAAGSLSGTVTVEGGQTPVLGVDVEVSPAAGAGAVSFATTDENGHYSVAGLPAGAFVVCFYPPSGNGPGFVGECYDNAPLNGSTAPTTVPIAQGATATGIDAHLATSGGIAGSVTAGGAALAAVDVEIYPAGNVGVQQSTITAENGTYAVSGLLAGTYTVCFYPASAYVAQCFDNKVVDGTSVPDPVRVTSGSTASGIDAALLAAGSIAGTATNGSVGLAGVDVEITLDGTAGSTRYATTGADGHYVVTGLPAGDYSVCFFSPAGPGGGFSSECYGSNPVTVASGAAVTGIDVALSAGGSIAGTVTSGQVGVAGVDVEVTPSGSTGSQMATSTAEDGTYAVRGLPPGSYTVCFYPADGSLKSQCYAGVPADGSVTPPSVDVRSGTPASGIDAALVSS